MKIIVALLLGGSASVQPAVLSSKGDCLAPMAAARTIDGVTLIDSDTVHWRSGLPAGLPPVIGHAPWFRADAYAHASSRDGGSVDLIQSTLLQGGRRGAYRQLRRLYVLCGQGTDRTVCLEMGLGSPPYFVDRRFGEPWRIDTGSDLVAAPPLAAPTALYVTRWKGALLVAAITDAGPRANRDRDAYLVSTRTGSVRVQCRCRTGRCSRP